MPLMSLLCSFSAGVLHENSEDHEAFSLSLQNYNTRSRYESEQGQIHAPLNALSKILQRPDVFHVNTAC